MNLKQNKALKIFILFVSAILLTITGLLAFIVYEKQLTRHGDVWYQAAVTLNLEERMTWITPLLVILGGLVITSVLLFVGFWFLFKTRELPAESEGTKSFSMENINAERILLAFFDIQAYSAFIVNNSKNDCLAKAENLFKYIKKDVGYSHVLDIRLRHWIFSDSIIMIPDIEKRPLDIAAIDFFIAMCSGLLFRGIRAGLPLRGAIGTGYFYKNDDIIISSALVDAATYEKEQNWLGAVITPSALSLINEIHPGFENDYKSLLNFERFLDNGKIPWKDSKPKHGKDIPKPDHSFYIKPAMSFANWREYLPKYIEIDNKVKASDFLYRDASALSDE